MRRRLGVVCGIGLLTFVLAASAAAEEGTLAMRPSEPWAIPLADTELETIRGGFFGMAFSVFFQGFFDNLGNTAGHLTVTTGGLLSSLNGGTTIAPAETPTGGGTTPTTPTPVPDLTVQNEQVRISTILSGSGILQINQVPGNFNVVHNNLIVNIAILRLENSAALSANLASLLRPF